MNIYMTDQEYNTCFFDFWGIRGEIITYLMNFDLHNSQKILDILSGHGLLAIEAKKRLPNTHVSAIGLENDLQSFEGFKQSLKITKEQLLAEKINYQVMDVRELTFEDESFDFVINFLGLEDVNMTGGKEGLKEALSEAVRVVKPDGHVQITLSLEGTGEDEKLAQEISQFIGHNAIFYPKTFYIEILENLDMQLVGEKWFKTNRKMTKEQAKEELEFACTKTKEIFKNYNVETVSFEDLWSQYGKKIEKYGVAYYSKLCILVFEKN